MCDFHLKWLINLLVTLGPPLIQKQIYRTQESLQYKRSVRVIVHYLLRGKKNPTTINTTKLDLELYSLSSK
jgi:hypothetical protein